MKLTFILLLLVLIGCKSQESEAFQQSKSVNKELYRIQRVEDSMIRDNIKRGKPVSEMKTIYDSLGRIRTNLQKLQDSLINEMK